MKSRMRLQQEGKYFVWNYWDPAGPWDYKPDGSPKHWVGVHPNGGYYAVDVEGIAAAYEHGLVFDKEDLRRLIATNRDFMWNQQIQGAKFQRIDGGKPDPRWKGSPGVLWTALVPHDETLRRSSRQTTSRTIGADCRPRPGIWPCHNGKPDYCLLSTGFLGALPDSSSRNLSAASCASFWSR